MKFRKKPVVIEAFKFGHHTWPDWFQKAILECDVSIKKETIAGHVTCDCQIKTLEGHMRVNQGDWVIQGVKGELYPCKDDIFHQTYERVQEAEAK